MPVFNTANLLDYGLIGLHFVIISWVGIYAARRKGIAILYLTRDRSRPMGKTTL